MKKQESKVKKEYLARTGCPINKEDVQEVGEFIEKNTNKTTPELLEEIKKNKQSAIYKYIQWDDSIASEMYRLSQVRNIVNHIEIKIVRVGNTEPYVLNIQTRAFHSVIKTEETGMYDGERVYVNNDEAMSKADLRIQVIERAKNELKNWIQRFNQYQELDIYIQTIQGLLDKEED